MRETKLYRYASVRETESFTAPEIVFPTSLVNQPALRGTWAGLVDFSIAWRVEDGRILVFENIFSRKGLRLNLSGPLTCRPLLRVGGAVGARVIEAVLSCHSKQCIVLRIRVTIPASNSSTNFTCEEISRLMLHRSSITCITDVDDAVVIGFDNGCCGQMRFSGVHGEDISITMFATPTTVNMESRRHGEDTSLVSGLSEDASSHRSAASSMSFGLMNRLFGTPRVPAVPLALDAVEGTSQTLTQAPRFLRRRREGKFSESELRDRVLDVAKVNMNGKVVASLHESGRLCVYVAWEAEFQFIADIVLPAKLSKGLVNHFLLCGPSDSVLAVVMCDEDPNADSLRLFNVTVKLRGEGSMSLSSMQIARRDGPVDRVVAASFTGDDVIIASETGYVSGVLNVSSDVDTNAGIPTGTLWTALDDVDQAFGFGKVLDSVVSELQESLLQAHRYSVTAVAKALRLQNPASLSRTEIEEAVRSIIFESDAENMWKRVKARADYISKSEDLLVRDLSLVRGVGIVVARRASLFVLREILDPEQKAIGSSTHLLSAKEPMSNRELACLLSSHAACQVIGSQLKNEKGEEAGKEEVKSKLKFMLMMGVSFSRVIEDVPLSDRMALQESKHSLAATSTGNTFSSIVSRMTTTLEPGPALLCFLNRSSEMDQLLHAADQVADKLPIAAMFASGLSWLSQFRMNSGSSPIDVEDAVQDAQITEEGSLGQPSTFLKKAYACLVSAADWCNKDLESVGEDVLCTLNLAGLSDHDLGTEEQHNTEDVIMGGDFERLPKGPRAAEIRQNLGFWLLERSVRLLEGSGAPKSAAAVALEAMSRAPDRRRHEMMRAAAFSTFLDAEELSHALTALLRQPFVTADASHVVIEESDALRDAVGLFMSAVADREELQWLADSKLPEPLHVLCGQTLERRARTTDAMRLELPACEKRKFVDPFRRSDKEETESPVKKVEPYEQLYSWHTMRGDESSAASCALEWGERLSNEGLNAIRSVTLNSALRLTTEQQIGLLLSWAKLKCQAYSFASSATQLEPVERRYIARSRFSLLRAGSQKRINGIVNVAWASRRHLLAYAQSKILAEMLSDQEGDQGISQTVPYLTSPNSNLLAEERDGIMWVTAMLTRRASYDKMLLCMELGYAWREDFGDEIVIEVVKRAASLASQESIPDFGYTELGDLLQAVDSMEGRESLRNWSLVALESALSTTAGVVGSPQWLVNAAAWGTPAFAEGTLESEGGFCEKKKGDVAGVVRALLRNHRPVEAARVLLISLANQEEATNSDRSHLRFYVPYSAVDATIEMLEDLGDEYIDAKKYKKKLEDSVQTHMVRMEGVMESGANERMEVMAM